MKHPPKKLQGILWSSPVEMLDLEKHNGYIIHQTLMYGTFPNIKWLFKTYPTKQIKEVFFNQPHKVYTIEAFNYIKNYVLKLNRHQISPTKYVNSLYGSS